MSERLKPNQIRRQENRKIAHGVRLNGTVYFKGIPRTDTTILQKKKQLGK